MIDDLRILRGFVAVAEELNFRKAAERLHMSQPPLSRMISALESEVNATLFTRSTRKVELTREGAIFLEAARDVLDSAAAAGRRIRREISSPQRPLQIGCTSTAYFVGFPDLLGNFRAAHPDTPVEVRSMNSADQVEALVSGRLDVGFVLPSASHPQLTSTPFRSLRMRLAVPSDHPHGQSGQPVPLERFRHDLFILHNPVQDPGMYEGILRCCTRAGFRPRVRVKRDDEHCMSLVTSGAGIHFSAAAAPCVAISGVSFIDLAGEAPTVGIHVIRRSDDPFPPLRNFLHMAQTPSPPLQTYPLG
ncbi:MAG: hypothetical protein JWO82_3992 [Akkermansiaceae bacterium]|nr:hypothetical protein [Akkermansiaceae bacterium]